MWHARYCLRGFIWRRLGDWTVRFAFTTAGVPTDIAKYCTNLEECAIESNKDDCDEFVLTILARNPKLRVLTLHCKDTLLLRAFQTVPNLVELTVGRASWTELGSVLDSYLQQLPATLKRLCWPAAACDGEYWLDRLFTRCPSLTDLHIGDLGTSCIHSMRSNLAPRLLKFQFKIEQEDMEDVPSVEALTCLSAAIPQLQTLIMSASGGGDGGEEIPLYMSQSHFNVILDSFQHLRQLVTNHYCIRMSPHPLPPLPATLRIEHSQSLLQELLITVKSNHFDGADRIFDAASLFDRCPLLTTISVDCNLPHLLACAMKDGRCTKKIAVTNIRYDLSPQLAGLEVLCGLEELTLLTICESIPESLFFQIAKNNSTLRVLHLQDVPSEMASAVLYQFLEKCPGLRSVEFWVANSVRLVSNVQMESDVRKRYLNLRHFKTNIKLPVTGLRDFCSIA